MPTTSSGRLLTNLPLLSSQRGPGVTLQSIVKAATNNEDEVKQISQKAFELCTEDVQGAAYQLIKLLGVSVQSATAILAAYDDRVPHYSEEFILVFLFTKPRYNLPSYIDFCKATHTHLSKDIHFNTMEELEMACWSLGTSPAFYQKHLPRNPEAGDSASSATGPFMPPDAPQSSIYWGKATTAQTARRKRIPFALPRTISSADKAKKKAVTRSDTRTKRK